MFVLLFGAELWYAAVRVIKIRDTQRAAAKDSATSPDELTAIANSFWVRHDFETARALVLNNSSPTEALRALKQTPYWPKIKWFLTMNVHAPPDLLAEISKTNSGNTVRRIVPIPATLHREENTLEPGVPSTLHLGWNDNRIYLSLADSDKRVCDNTQKDRTYDMPNCSAYADSIDDAGTGDAADSSTGNIDLTYLTKGKYQLSIYGAETGPWEAELQLRATDDKLQNLLLSGQIQYKRVIHLTLDIDPAPGSKVRISGDPGVSVRVR